MRRGGWLTILFPELQSEIIASWKGRIALGKIEMIDIKV
jgi:hypothetical protein